MGSEMCIRDRFKRGDGGGEMRSEEGYLVNCVSWEKSMQFVKV